MKVLVLGASGATGRLVVMQLAKRRVPCRILVREGATLPGEILDNPLVEARRGSISELSQAGMLELLEGCDAAVSCLGHNLSLRGMFGHPRNLVSGTVRKLAEAAEKTGSAKLRLVLMGTTAYTNPVLGERNPAVEGFLFAVMKLLLPPHRDNVRAADFLQERLGDKSGRLEWIVVRPDSLLNEAEESAYEVHEAKIRSPLSNPGKTSRINVSRFMAELLLDEGLWRQWLFRMPVVYNREDAAAG